MVYKLFSTCKLIKGVSQSLLIDNQRANYYSIPHSLGFFLMQIENKTETEIFQMFRDQIAVVNEYLQFLLENEIIFLCNPLIAENFCDLSENFETPNLISNSIVEINIIDYSFVNEILTQLGKLHCFNIVFIIHQELFQKEILSFLNYVSNFDLEDLTLVLPNIQEPIIFKGLKDKYPYLTTIILNELLKNEHELNDLLVKYVNPNYDFNKFCGVVNTDYFNLHYKHFTESLAHNTCLNRKISIDKEGNIKNCPSMKESFGNIKDTSLQEAIEKPGFKKYWNITKDQIAVCKDCEFRHVCTDCRAYLEDPEDDYSKPLKCGYNPYTCEWEEWSTNPLKQKAIDYYGMREIIKN